MCALLYELGTPMYINKQISHRDGAGCTRARIIIRYM